MSSAVRTTPPRSGTTRASWSTHSPRPRTGSWPASLAEDIRSGRSTFAYRARSRRAGHGGGGRYPGGGGTRQCGGGGGGGRVGQWRSPEGDSWQGTRWVALGGHGGTGGGGGGWWWWSGSGAGAGAGAGAWGAVVDALAYGGSGGAEEEATWWVRETTAEMRRRDVVAAATAAAVSESARGSALTTAAEDGSESGMAAADTAYDALAEYRMLRVRE
ncbi:hypothetical protein SETIT_5G415500v2 [Setaria italica]|uniref:Uncharacterized protein n=1 Tax=Setaria italica TaxID=4555 RepID=A0A368REE9_SETIT|nr:hypothetical protein SETIT_5G415500v2 [Setaria italica]